MTQSKPLGHDDSSGFEFVKRAMGGNVTAAINFDRLQKHPARGYIIFELLKCEEDQRVTPYTSHPNRYWHRNSRKFLSLWRAKQDFNATLYLVNYSDAGTEYADQVLLIEVLDMDENGITDEKQTAHTMATFSAWFVAMNNQCLEPKEQLIYDIYKNKSAEELGKIQMKKGKYRDKSLAEIYMAQPDYLAWLSGTRCEYSIAAGCYLEKLRNARSERDDT